MKVYVITQGCYSDYHICAVTLDKDEAEHLRKIYTARECWSGYFSNDDIAQIEVYETSDTGDTFTEEEKNSDPIEYYNVKILYDEKKRKSSINIEENTIFILEDKGVVLDEEIRRTRRYYHPFFEDLIEYTVLIKADRSVEDVKKIALDRFYMKLAEMYGL